MSDIDRPVIFGKLVTLPLQVGVVLDVMPLTPSLISKIAQAARELFPDPDPEQYRLPLTNPLIPGEKDVAANNPAYIEQIDKLKTHRQEYTLERIIGLSCKAAGMDELIERYQWQLNELSDFSPVYAQWAAIIRYFLATPEEVAQILSIAQDKAPLTEGEIIDGYARFQLALSTPKRKRVHNK